MKSALAAFFVAGSMGLWAADSGTAEMMDIPVFRVEAAEVRVTFTAYGDHNQRVTDLSPRDLKVLRDGVEVRTVTGLEDTKEAPLAMVLMCDVSESMKSTLPLQEAVKSYLSQSASAKSDEVSFVDFGALVQERNSRKLTHRLTSLYDSALDLMRAHPADELRRAIVLISDGRDNYSLHNLNDTIEAAQRRDLPFYTVAVESRRSTNEEKVLRTLSARTGGRFYSVRNKAQMLAAIREIEEELRSAFVVTFRADDHFAGSHRLAIQSRGRNLRFLHKSAYYQPGDSSTQPVQSIWPQIASR